MFASRFSFVRKIGFIVCVLALLLAAGATVSAQKPQSPDAPNWEQIITPLALGSGFDYRNPGGWVLIKSQNTVYCSTDSNNVIYTQTRAVGGSGDVDWASWRPTIPSAGLYDVYVYVPNYSNTRGVTGQARYKIAYNGGETTQVINQNNNKCTWVWLGQYQFAAGTSGYVYMGDWTGDNPIRLIAADGMKFVQVTPPALTRSRLYVDSRNYLVLEFCGINIHQDVYIGSKRSGRDFGVHAKRADFGGAEQCAVDDNLADGGVLASTTYHSGVALIQSNVYTICTAPNGLCNDVTTSAIIPVPQPTPPPSPPGACAVPFYWQSDRSWGGNTMRTCGKDISHAGCALTSAAMLLKYYGANQNPGSLNTCLGNYACLINWGKVPGCSQGKVSYQGWPSFSWSKLESELKQNHPVILQLNRTGGMHFVLAVSGSGSSASGYLVNDPALKQGQRVKLSAVLARGYNSINSMRLYAGTPPSCAATSVNTEQPVSAQFSAESLAASNRLSMATAVTGTADLYWNTEISMTFELAAFSPAGNVTDILVWTDSLSNTIWQPFAQYVEVPLSAQLFVQFRDELGSISEIYSSSSLPEESPGQGQDSLYLPLVTKDLITP